MPSAIDRLVEIIHDPPASSTWKQENQTAMEGLFGGADGRYPVSAATSVKLRANPAEGDANVPFFAYIHPSNPDSGGYGGMSLAGFPMSGQPCLVTLVIGTNGLSPDEEILGRPGHARKSQAICAWLNSTYGASNMVAWAKQDPVRTDISIPDSVRKQFQSYDSVFGKYGSVLYAIYAPTEDRAATRIALSAFLDLMFDERGYDALGPSKADKERVQSLWFRHLMPTVTQSEVLDLLRARKYVVLQGPPGTGKTRMARNLLSGPFAGNGQSIQFHANTTYETFVGGLAPVRTGESIGLSFAPVRGHLMEAAKRALEDENRDYLLHIDELNRADLAKVLGEAIYLFEPQEKRDVNLPYDFGEPFEQKFSLPENLHVIGTMNSADRSLGAIDVAVRRRFAFVRLWPDARVVDDLADDLMRRAFEQLLGIFVDHALDDALDLVPGHSYFLNLAGLTSQQQLRVSVKPLLEEYLAQGFVTGFSEQIRAYLQWLDSL
jgi:5-methylcytosine-specific restriction protein B